ncbi:MAG: hypothetical protein A2563_04955 [Candidatus Magasanikbacteria bacterium RIFOXYD1_FULL_40_23]|uniref:Uncharacterized protein n=1 Tax=Candidatus Magasanikbacteria bacterium RIFOXYD1_FULL_40_23 TaxID=1798705 RepID=A0A1F6P8N1_9BACT|nr:MAG: hypothetical protein A2563_04955 [Candidatus Magasanikbacteria bacterium RIFOXYD1_FULL_40_23]
MYLCLELPSALSHFCPELKHLSITGVLKQQDKFFLLKSKKQPFAITVASSAKVHMLGYRPDTVGQRFDIRAYTKLCVLATVKWSGPDFLVWIGGHATILFDHQNDMSRWKYRQVSISSETFPSSFWFQKVES